MNLPIPDAANNPFHSTTESVRSYRTRLTQQLSNWPKTDAPENHAFARSIVRRLGSQDNESVASSVEGERFLVAAAGKGAGGGKKRGAPGKTPKTILKPKPTNVNAAKRQISFTDLDGPNKRAKSYQSVHLSSFELSAKAPRIRYFAAIDTPGLDVLIQGGDPDVQDQLYGPALGQETPGGIHAFVARLASMMPGMRFVERIYAHGPPSYQSIIDFMGVQGLLSTRVLELFRASNVTEISLSASMQDHLEGLNLGGRDVFAVFKKPNSFRTLSGLSLENVPLKDWNINDIHKLPQLSTLVLDNTGIGNVAIFLLMPLQKTLSQLYVRGNPRIDDSCISVLTALINLRFLAIHGTSIRMPGLRLLTRVIPLEKRVLDIEMPAVCDEYFTTLDERYKSTLKPPLIHDPKACARLSLVNLKRNLAAHATHVARAGASSTIVVGGTKAEMVERLQKILETRKADLLIKRLVWGGEDEDGDEEEVEDEEVEVVNSMDSGFF